MSEQVQKNKKKNFKLELKKILKTASIPNCQLKLTTKYSYDLLGGYLLKNVVRNKVSILNPRSVSIEHIEKLNNLKAELQEFCEVVEKDDENLETDCYLKDNKRVYMKSDRFIPLELFDLEKNSLINLDLKNSDNNEYLVVFSYLTLAEQEISNIKLILKHLSEQKRENLKIVYIFCPEIDQVVEDDIEIEEEDDDEEEDKEEDTKKEVNFKALLDDSIKSIMNYTKSEEFEKNYNNASINFYYMENLAEKMQDMNDVLNLYTLTQNFFLFYLLNSQGSIVNIAKDIKEIFVITEETQNAEAETISENPISISEKEIHAIEKKLDSLKFDEFNKANYEFIYYNLFFKTVFHINDKNMEKKFDNYPRIKFYLPKSHDVVHKEICKVLEEKKILDKINIEGVMIDTKEEVSNYLRFFKKECEKEGINIMPNDIELTFVKKILNEDRKKKINFKVILKEENNNKDYFLKMGRVKETVGKLYDQKNSKFQIFYKINVIQNFKEGEKFVKIPSLIDLKDNKEVDLKFPEGKIFIVNYFNVIFGEKNCNIRILNELMDKNKENWGNKVIVAAITNYPEIKLNTYIKNNNITNIDFFHEQRDLPCFDYLYEKKEKFPEIIIVNKFGTIVYTGNVDEYVQLESFIDILLGSNEDLILNNDKFFVTNVPKVNLNMDITPGTLKPLGKKFDQFYYENVYDKCEYDYKFKFVLEKKMLFDENFNIIGKQVKRIHLDAFLFENEKKTLDNYLSKEVYPSLSQEIFKPNITLMKEEVVSLKKHCDKCQSKLDKKNYYACYWCKISLCEQCGETRDLTKLGFERYSHPHNLIFINSKITSSAIKVETHKLGNNIFEKINNIDMDSTEKFSDCNGCRKYIKKGYRFTCLNCVPGYREEGYNDICEKCFAVLKNSSHKKYKQVILNLKEFEHDHNSHAFLRIAYSKTYFDF